MEREINNIPILSQRNILSFDNWDLKLLKYNTDEKFSIPIHLWKWDIDLIINAQDNLLYLKELTKLNDEFIKLWKNKPIPEWNETYNHAFNNGWQRAYADILELLRKYNIYSGEIIYATINIKAKESIE